MSNVISITGNNDRPEKIDSRDKIIIALSELITAEGLAACTHRRIAEYANIPVGSVQYHFGTKSKLFEAMLDYCYNDYIKMVDREEVLSGTLEERVTLFISLSWRHYQSDLYLSLVEVLMSTRRLQDVRGQVDMTKQFAVTMSGILRKICPECTLDDRALMEVLVSNHCYLTGLSTFMVLNPTLGNIGGYLRRAKRAMLAMLQAP